VPGADDLAPTSTGAFERPWSPAQSLTEGLAFGPRYRILKILGHGGMGTVYQAWDDELGVAVALKVIRADPEADPQTARALEQRLKRELLLARQVTHKHVVRIHDFGDVAGVKYLTMPCIQGEDLAARLRREGRLPLRDALDLAKQIASGLAAAHDAGVVHRDLKPENVMIDESGQAVIMDFGIARSESATLTRSGAVVGTLAYMAPEQAQGQPVDHRADIYAFGLILYDLIGGRWRTSRHDSPMSEMLARINTPLPPLRSVAPETTPALDAIISRCVERDPDRRYQTTADLLADLQRLDADAHPSRAIGAVARPTAWIYATAVLAVVAAVALAGTWWLARNRGGPPAAAHEPVSVLIADFENRAGDPVFDGSLEQPLAVALEEAPFVTTYARRDALSVAGQMGQAAADGHLDVETARLVSQREGIKVVLAGEVDREGADYRVSVRAIDAVPGTTLATADAVARSKGDVLRAVAGVASRIREALGDTTPESQRLAAAETFTASSLEAASAYAKAQQLMSNGKYRESIDEYKRAVEADPDFGRAYAAWAVSAFQLGQKDEAERLYQKAFGLLDRMTEREKYRTYGAYYLSVAENYPKAVENYEKLVTLYPFDRAGHSNLALAYFYTLDFPKALEHGRRAIEIYRGSPKFRSNYALYAMYAGDFATASSVAEGLVADTPSYYRGYLPIAMAAVAAGDVGRARGAYESMAQAGGQGASLAAMGQADLSMYTGDVQGAIETLTAGIAVDMKGDNEAALGAKRVALAEALLASGQDATAAASAREVCALVDTPAVVLPAARVLVRANHLAGAQAVADALAARIQPQNRAYAKLIEMEMALSERRMPDAVALALAAQQLSDLWLTRLGLGIAYVEAGAFGDAIPELEACLKRRGEATAVFLDEVPSIRYLPPVYYWLGRAREGLGLTAQAAESYRTFLAIKANGDEQGLVADARRRLESR